MHGCVTTGPDPYLGVGCGGRLLARLLAALHSLLPQTHAHAHTHTHTHTHSGRMAALHASIMLRGIRTAASASASSSSSSSSAAAAAQTPSRQKEEMSETFFAFVRAYEGFAPAPFAPALFASGKRPVPITRPSRLLIGKRGTPPSSSSNAFSGDSHCCGLMRYFFTTV